jgi:hypothetical protein
MKRYSHLKYYLSIALLLFSFNSLLYGSDDIVLIKLSDHNITEQDESYTTGSFCRIYFHPVRNKFYVTFSGLSFGAPDDTPSSQDYVYREYEVPFAYTGKTDTFENFNGASDYAMAFVKDHYYHLTGCPVGYQLTKLDSDFHFVDRVEIPLSEYDHGNDQMLNFTNDHIHFGAVYDTVGGQNKEVYQHIFIYDTLLNEIDNVVLLDEPFMVSGASILFNNQKYHFITGDQIGDQQFNNPSILYAYQYSPQWDYLGKIQLDESGQWSQGALFSDGYYYVAYHTPGYHGQGNVAVGIYDIQWQPVKKEMVTHYDIQKDTVVVQRPFLLKHGNRLFVTYDIESFSKTGEGNRDWQAMLTIFEIQFTPSGVDFLQQSSSISDFTLYPNPTNSFLMIEHDTDLSGNIAVEIVDMLGRRLLIKKLGGKSQIRLDVKEFKSGVCFAVMRGKSGIQCTKKYVLIR